MRELSFFERLKMIREKFGVSRDDLATHLGLSYSTISKYEDGTRTPDIDNLEKIADYFGISVEYLLGKSEVQQITSPDSIFSEMKNLVDRFVSVFENHKISITQIANVIDPKFNMRISDFKDYSSILKKLDAELLTWTSDTFGVSEKWLYGVDSYIYKEYDFYKHIHSFIKLIVELKKVDRYVTVVFLKSGMLQPDKEHDQYIVMVIKYKKDTNGHRTQCYLPIATTWDWSHWRSRYQAKSIMFICNKLKVQMDGYDINESDRQKIRNLKVFPQTILNKINSGYTWYPECYISVEGFTPLEQEELDSVIQYIKDENYMVYLEDELKRINKEFKNESNNKHNIDNL